MWLPNLPQCEYLTKKLDEFCITISQKDIKLVRQVICPDMFPGVSLRAGHRANRPAVRAILPSWFDHLAESFSSEKDQFK